MALISTLLLQSAAWSDDPRPADDTESETRDASSNAEEVIEQPSPAAEEVEPSFRSGPPDTTPYTRPIVPEDYAPQGKPAIPPGVTVPAPDESTRKESEDDPDREGNG